MNFGRTNKVKGIAISKKFIRNISIILKIATIYITRTLREAFLNIHIHFAMKKSEKTTIKYQLLHIQKIRL